MSAGRNIAEAIEAWRALSDTERGMVERRCLAGACSKIEVEPFAAALALLRAAAEPHDSSHDGCVSGHDAAAEPEAHHFPLCKHCGATICYGACPCQRKAAGPEAKDDDKDMTYAQRLGWNK